ncbi:MAG: AAA family ATPase [Blastocatellia bacterium]
MKFPYGIADFHQIITEGYFYADRTGFIPRIEDAGPQLFFLRPRRFGKSLLLSTLENYYDLRKADEFDHLFGRLAIGRNPTPTHNQYFVLKWDFSVVDYSGSAEQIRKSLHNHINGRSEFFAAYYREHLAHPIQITPEDAFASFQSLLGAVRFTPYKLYLLIDEYDSFGNEVLRSERWPSQSRHDDLLDAERSLKAIVKLVKAALTGMGLDRVFITGVTPLVLSDAIGDYNVAFNVSRWPQFHNLCGFTEAEITDVLSKMAAERGLRTSDVEDALLQMRLYYLGYCFSDEPKDLVYNPTQTLYFLDHFQQERHSPIEMLDSNLAMDRGAIDYVARHSYGPRLLAEAVGDDSDLSVRVLAEGSGVYDLLTTRKNADFLRSMLYYFGVLTLAGENAYRELRLRIPNMIIRGLFVERLKALMLPEIEDQKEGRLAAETLYQSGALDPLCDFIERRYFKVLSNHDRPQANEVTVKTAFLTLLFNDLLYIMDSEATAGRRQADLTMIVRPNARQYQVFDLLLEFKFLIPSDARLSDDEARGMSREELTRLPAVQRKLAEARAQTPAYRRGLEERHKTQLRLRAFAVVALGFERVVWEEIPYSAIA